MHLQIHRNLECQSINRSKYYLL